MTSEVGAGTGVEGSGLGVFVRRLGGGGEMGGSRGWWLAHSLAATAYAYAASCRLGI